MRRLLWVLVVSAALAAGLAAYNYLSRAPEPDTLVLTVVNGTSHNITAPSGTVYVMGEDSSSWYYCDGRWHLISRGRR